VIKSGSLPLDITELLVKNRNYYENNSIEGKQITNPNIPLYALDSTKAILKTLLAFDEVRDSTFVVHTVTEGESLPTIQRFYGVSEECLKRWNYLEDNILIDGMKLKVCKRTDWVKILKQGEKILEDELIIHSFTEDYEYIYNIARKYNTSEKALNVINQRELLYSLQRSQKLIVGIKIHDFCECKE
jgi:LysM repeat protein